MPPASKSIHDYIALANDNDLEYKEVFAPSTVWVKVHWFCPTCGRTHYRSYHALKYMQFPCRCRNGRSLSVTEYHELADELGIAFVNEYVPRNIFQPVKWRLADGEIITATYRDLKYTKLGEQVNA